MSPYFVDLFAPGRVPVLDVAQGYAFVGDTSPGTKPSRIPATHLPDRTVARISHQAATEA